MTTPTEGTPEEQPTGIVYYQDASRRMLFAFEDRLQAMIPNSVVQYLRLCAHPVVAFFHCLYVLNSIRLTSQCSNIALYRTIPTILSLFHDGTYLYCRNDTHNSGNNNNRIH